MTKLNSPLDFILSGCAIFTVENTKTGNRFTYKVVQNAPNSPHFVKALTGPDNTWNYEFLGTIFDSKKYWHGKKSRISRTAQSAKVFAWTWDKLTNGGLPECIEIHHEGYCGRCGKLLTVPENIESGYGPTCQKIMEEGI